ncbi:NADase-type glycan-binding domain-containing protein [Streptomyces noursei]|uniref:NADase-type glycan-binding domain-containing protein n=1 Tax=Streptomyces noursei TaxID=1971 RepID=UPI00382F6A1A
MTAPRTCPTCGASNAPGDDFCHNCGSYLGWSEGPRTTDTPPTTPTAPDVPADPGPATKPAATTDAPAGSRTPTATPAPPSTPRTSPSSGDHRTTNAPHATEDAKGTTNTRGTGRTTDTRDTRDTTDTGGTSGITGARAEGTGTAAPNRPEPPPAAPGPTAPDTGPPDPILPVQPAKPVAPRPVVRPAAAPEEAAGPPCPRCGTPNPPNRRFCRRCAAPLNPAAARAPLPWWRTIWPFRRRVRAGSGRAIRLLVILALVLALCLGGFLLLPAGRALFQDTLDKLGGAKAITPVGVSASAQVGPHPAKNTTDHLRDRYWGAPGAGATVTYTFGTPFRLVDLIITNGASVSPEEYTREARALRMDLEVTSADGTVHRSTLTLADKPGAQPFPTGISEVTTVRLTLHSVTGLTAGRHVALAEVEFFQRT